MTVFPTCQTWSVPKSAMSCSIHASATLVGHTGAVKLLTSPLLYY